MERKNKKKPGPDETSLIPFSAAEYLTFVATTIINKFTIYQIFAENRLTGKIIDKNFGQAELYSVPQKEYLNNTPCLDE